MATLTVTQSKPFKDSELGNITDIVFEFDSGQAVAQFKGNQFDVGLISSSVHIVGNGRDDEIHVQLDANSIGFIAAGWTFENWQDSTDFTRGQITLLGAASADTIIGSVRADFISGFTGNDRLTGLDGDDLLIGGLGHDTLFGGKGNDTFQLDSSTAFGDRSNPTFCYDEIREAAGEGFDVVEIHAIIPSLRGYVLPANVESADILVEGEAFNLIGSDAANRLRGNDSGNHLDGRGGGDFLDGRGGNDTLDGGAGGDSLDAGLGNDSVDGGEGLDTLVGNSGDDTLDGGLGRDTLDGGFGDDRLIYSSARTSADDVDLFIGGEGVDTFVLSHEGLDRRTVSLAVGEFTAGDLLRGELKDIENVTVAAGHTVIGNRGDNVIIGTSLVKPNDFSGGFGNDTLDGGGGNDRLEGGGDDDALFGGSGDDRLDGGDGNDLLSDSSGDDTLDGGVGGDLMFGGKGNDLYFVDALDDVVEEQPGDGVDTVDTTVGFSLKGQHIEKLNLKGIIAINADGNGLANTIVGNAASNVIDGMAGADTLTGGAGGDRFVFSQALAKGSADTITDFFAPDDSIRLSQDVFEALGKGLLLPAFFKNISTGRIDADDRILYRQDDGHLFYDADGSGAQFGAVRFAILANHAAISAADFLVI